jgi:hypothetical protein
VKKNEELMAELEKAENQDEGIRSTTHRQVERKEKLDDKEQVLVNTMKSMGASQESIDSSLKKFREKKGSK